MKIRGTRRENKWLKEVKMGLNIRGRRGREEYEGKKGKICLEETQEERRGVKSRKLDKDEK